MVKLSRSDWIIGIALVAVLVALFAVALVRHLEDETSATGTVSDHLAGATAAVSPRPGRPNDDTGQSTVPSTPDPVAGSIPPTTSGLVGAQVAPATSTTSTTSGGPGPVAGPVTAVGDSIMIDIQSDLEADVPGVQVNGMVSRQFETGISVVQADRAAGTLGNVLVVELGTNGTVTSPDFDAMMQAAAGVARVVFVNINVPRSWEAEDNAVLAAGVARYPGVAVLANWNAVSTGHPEWFTPDQVHLEPAGAEALANLIASYT